MGDIEAIAIRGAWTGNRGILHRGHEIVRFHAGSLWITCALAFRDRWHEQWRPHHFTWLYFLDEAVSMAAGHRPCAECRRNSYNAFRGAWDGEHGTGAATAAAMDRRLHGERIVRGTHRRRIHRMPWAELTDGAFVLVDESPAVAVDGHLARWTREGYAAPFLRRPRSGHADVITPPSTVAVLRAGYPVQIDEAARG